MRSVIVASGVLLLLSGCEDPPPSSPSSSPPASAAPAAARLPGGDPRDLPKVPADDASVRRMLGERFGEPVARNIRIAVEQGPGGVRLRATGEVPNEEFRTAIMNELSARVEGLKFEDFNLDLAGPCPLLWGFDANIGGSDLVVFSPDLSLAATQRGDVYEVATGRRLNRLGLTPFREIRSAAFSPDGKTLATGHEDGVILLWDMPLGASHRVLSPAAGPTASHHVLAVQFTADGRTLVTLNRVRGELHAWDLATGSAKLIGAHQPNAAPHEMADPYLVAVSPDGKTIASANGYDDGVVLWDVAARRRTGLLKGERFYPDVAAWSKDGKRLAASRFAGKDAGTVIVWDMPGQRPRAFEPDENSAVQAVAFSDDARTLAVRYKGGAVRMWDLGDGSPWQDIAYEKSGDGPGLRFSPNGSVLATECAALRPPGIRLWDVSRRPGASGAPAALPPTLGDSVVVRDDLLVQEIELAVRGTFDRRNIESLTVEALPDGRVRLTGKVSSQSVKDVAGRTAGTHRPRWESGPMSPREVINELEVTGRYGAP